MATMTIPLVFLVFLVSLFYCSIIALDNLPYGLLSEDIESALKEYSHAHPTLSNVLIFEMNSATGTGNKLQTAASALHLAMLTRRALLIKMDALDVWPELFSEPKFKWHDLDRLASAMDGITSKRVNLDSLSLLREVACSNDLNNLFGSQRAVVFASSQYFAEVTLASPHCAREPWCAGASSNPTLNIFSLLIANIFTLSSQFAKELQQVKENMGWKPTDIVLGLQIRRHDRSQYLVDESIFEFSRCGLFLTQRMLQQQKQSKVDIKIFIAADMTESVKEVSSDLLEHGWVNGVMVIPYPNRTHDPLNVESVKFGVLDMILLSHCQQLILTPLSTFGLVPSLLAGGPTLGPTVVAGPGLEPYYITNIYGNSQVDIFGYPILVPTCIRSSYSQPICHECFFNEDVLWDKPADGSCPHSGFKKVGLVPLIGPQSWMMKYRQFRSNISHDLKINNKGLVDISAQVTIIVIFVSMMFLLARFIRRRRYASSYVLVVHKE